MAECLIPYMVLPQNIERIYVFSEEGIDFIISEIGDQPHPPIEVNPYMLP